MKKADLKSFMRTEYFDGTIRIVVIDESFSGLLNPSSGYFAFKGINEDLTLIDAYSDIIKVYDKPHDGWEFFDITKKGKLLWDRNEVKKPIFTHKGVEWSEQTLKSMIDNQMRT